MLSGAKDTPEFVDMHLIFCLIDLQLFVDIGTKESGLIHVSNLSDTFVKDVNAIVTLQQQIIVKVLEVDVVRKRIQLALVK